jgi:ABC-type lipoprotein export system ATPase subunit
MSIQIFDVNKVSFAYQLGSQKVQALKDVSLQIGSGEMVLLMGPSGSGKSTLLNLMGLIEPLAEGDIIFCGRSFASLGEQQLNHVRRFDIGFIFQSFLLFEVLTVRENIEYFLMRQQLPAAERSKRVEAVLAAVGLADKASCRPTELSGGQRQRVAIARAVAKKPRVIIADEPTANLDQHTASEILALLKGLAHEGNTIIMASHDPLALSYADRTLKLRDGHMTGEANS